jgi:hypothetical protein
VDQKIQDRFLSSGRRIDRRKLLFCSSILFLCRLKVDRWQATAPRLFNAKQSRCCSSCLRLRLPSLNKFVDYSRLRCPRSDRAHVRMLTAATTRSSASEWGRANGRWQQEQGNI